MYVACGFGFLGALLLLITPLLPLAYITVIGEVVEPPLAHGWLVAVLGLAAAAGPAMAIVRRDPLWATAMIVPAIVAIGWSGWQAFSNLPEKAQYAESASLGSGGMLFVFSGPV